MNRRFPRRHFGRGIGILVGGKYFMAQGLEIGEGGLAFKTDRALKVGALVVVSFQIPSGDFCAVRAEIRNQDRQGGDTASYGVAFENISFDRKREIRSFVINRSATEA